MNLYEMIIGLVVIVMAGRVLMTLFGSGEASAPESDPDAARLAQEVRQLRERVQVLERVITDGRPAADLDREIERLRDR